MISYKYLFSIPKKTPRVNECSPADDHCASAAVVCAPEAETGRLPTLSRAPLANYCSSAAVEWPPEAVNCAPAAVDCAPAAVDCAPAAVDCAPAAFDFLTAAVDSDDKYNTVIC